MNTSKAMCLMGLDITANVDAVIGEDPTETLNKAIFGQVTMASKHFFSSQNKLGCSRAGTGFVYK